MSSDPQTSLPAAEAPKSLFGYDVLHRIGEGAASTIYAVSDPKTGQLYALKHVRRKTERDSRYVEQIENEFAVSRKFNHPGLRRYFHCLYHRTLFRSVIDAALVMELVDGTPLDKLPPRPLSEVLDCFIQVAEALVFLHRLKIVHCDLKPNNILLDPAGRVKLIDFGQACPFGTVKERIQGTPDYIAPEQVRLKPVVAQTDLYNLGATLYWALTGQRAPTLYTVEKGQRDIVKECKFPSPRELIPAMPPALSDLVMHCLQHSRAKRPETMSVVLERLQECRGVKSIVISH